jgi:regulator of RNase E activity RraA
VTFKGDVNAMADDLAATGLKAEHVAAISAGLDDVFDGLHKVLDHLVIGIASDDRDEVWAARFEVDEHLRPHLRDLSKALVKLDGVLKKRRAKRVRLAPSSPRLADTGADMTIRSLPTAAIADAVVRHGLALRLGPVGLARVGEGAPIAGRVVPVRHVGSVDVFLEALERLGADASGRILVADNDGRLDEGCIGDLVTLECASAGIAGIVIWGLHRDTAELRRIGLPVFSLGTCPAGPRREDPRPTDVFERAGLGEVEVTADDVVFADDDGVVVVAAADLDRVVATASEIVATEAAQADRARAGTSLRDQFGFADYLARRVTDPSMTFRRHLRERRASIEE